MRPLVHSTPVTHLAAVDGVTGQTRVSSSTTQVRSRGVCRHRTLPATLPSTFEHSISPAARNHKQHFRSQPVRCERGSPGRAAEEATASTTPANARSLRRRALLWSAAALVASTAQQAAATTAELDKYRSKHRPKEESKDGVAALLQIEKESLLRAQQTWERERAALEKEKERLARDLEGIRADRAKLSKENKQLVQESKLQKATQRQQQVQQVGGAAAGVALVSGISSVYKNIGGPSLVASKIKEVVGENGASGKESGSGDQTESGDQSEAWPFPFPFPGAAGKPADGGVCVRAVQLHSSGRLSRVAVRVKTPGGGFGPDDASAWRAVAAAIEAAHARPGGPDEPVRVRHLARWVPPPVDILEPVLLTFAGPPVPATALPEPSSAPAPASPAEDPNDDGDDDASDPEPSQEEAQGEAQSAGARAARARGCLLADLRDDDILLWSQGDTSKQHDQRGEASAEHAANDSDPRDWLGQEAAFWDSVYEPQPPERRSGW